MTASVEPADGAALVHLAAAVVAGPLDRPPGTRRVARPRGPGAARGVVRHAGAAGRCAAASAPSTRPARSSATWSTTPYGPRDPRLPPDRRRLAGLDVKVSVLGRPARPAGRHAGTLLAALRPGVDGVLITDGTRRATFLPAVWAKLPDPEQFVDALLAKGGWPAGEWPAGMTAHRYPPSTATRRPAS